MAARTFTPFVALLGLCGCVSVPPGPSVLVLPGTGKSFDHFQTDEAACRQYALQQVGGTTPQQAANESAVATTVIGTAVGAAAGAAFGGGSGAAIGAGTGLLVGGAIGADAAGASAYTTQQRYDVTYLQCMYAKGNRVPIAAGFTPPPGALYSYPSPYPFDPGSRRAFDRRVGATPGWRPSARSQRQPPCSLSFRAALRPFRDRLQLVPSLKRAIALLNVARLIPATLAGLSVMVALGLLRGAATASADAEPAFAVLVFTKTAGYRHASIPAGIAAIKTLGDQHRFRVDATEAASAFTDESLAKYRAVVFLNTTGNVLDAGQQAAFQRFIRRGGGFVGVHSATDTEYEWPWYGELVGAYFRSHPAIQAATVKVVDATHASTRHLPEEWVRTDEWYDFRSHPGAGTKVLLRIDEASYAGGSMAANHPMAWYHAYDGGRAWYTALGHTVRSYDEAPFLSHLLGGIIWAAGATAE